MNEVNFCVNKVTGRRYRYIVEETGSYFVFGKRRRKYGWRYNSKANFENMYVPAEPDENKCWHRRLDRAIRCMQASGLWNDTILPLYQDLESLDYQDLQNLRDEFEEAVKAREKTSDGIVLPTPAYNALLQKYGDNVIESLADCRIKAMYFGTCYTREIRSCLQNAIANQTDYRSGRIESRYDVSVSYNAQKKQAWYSEEYRNCGNGHYYLALDAMHAVFYEDD